jgi:ketosteroid isomerase-like protein
MNDQQKTEQYSGVRDQEIRAALDQHWAASDANDFETEHRIYHEDAVLDYPQSGERTRGRRNIQNQRASQPSNKRFTVRRIIGGGDLWVTEFILTYDGKPSYTVSRYRRSRPLGMGFRHSTFSSGGTRRGLGTVGPVCAAR